MKKQRSEKKILKDLGNLYREIERLPHIDIHKSVYERLVRKLTKGLEEYKSILAKRQAREHISKEEALAPRPELDIVKKYAPSIEKK